MPSAQAEHTPPTPVTTSGSELLPLVVDLDGTLTPTNTLIESLILVLKRNVLDLLRLPFWLLRGRAAFKHSIAEKSSLSVADLPYCLPLLDYLRGEKRRGRCLVLATAAHQTIADAVATHLELFDDVIATSRTRNVKGANKLEAIRDRVGSRFVYAGDSAADLSVWKGAEAAILVGVRPDVAQSVRLHTSVEREFPRDNPGVTIWLRALRLHQWLKNLLLFVPLLTAFSLLEVEKVIALALAFLAFSLAASATYVINDLVDLDSDRAHPRKRHRPFASGQIPIESGVIAALAMLATAFVLAAVVSQAFLLVLVLYTVLTSVYSLVLKQLTVIDVLTLSVLYTLRIVAGAVASSIAISSWLLAFSVFIFFSLALVKRCSELVSAGHMGREAARGRGYKVSDLVVLWPLGVGSGLCAVVVFGLFISAPETQARYASPQIMWLVAIALLYWLSRLWIKSARAEMHDDPLVFAIRDFGSRMSILAMLAAAIAAKFLMIG